MSPISVTTYNVKKKRPTQSLFLLHYILGKRNMILYLDSNECNDYKPNIVI